MSKKQKWYALHEDTYSCLHNLHFSNQKAYSSAKEVSWSVVARYILAGKIKKYEPDFPDERYLEEHEEWIGWST